MTIKTIKDLEGMKNIPATVFGNQYDFFFARLEDYYISKANGLDRIRGELQEWDKESKRIIIEELINIINKRELLYFDKNELLSLIK